MKPKYIKKMNKIIQIPTDPLNTWGELLFNFQMDCQELILPYANREDEDPIFNAFEYTIMKYSTVEKVVKYIKDVFKSTNEVLLMLQLEVTDKPRYEELLKNFIRIDQFYKTPYLSYINTNSQIAKEFYKYLEENYK